MSFPDYYQIQNTRYGKDSFDKLRREHNVSVSICIYLSTPTQDSFEMFLPVGQTQYQTPRDQICYEGFVNLQIFISD